MKNLRFLAALLGAAWVVVGASAQTDQPVKKEKAQKEKREDGEITSSLLRLNASLRSAEENIPPPPLKLFLSRSEHQFTNRFTGLLAVEYLNEETAAEPIFERVGQDGRNAIASAIKLTLRETLVLNAAVSVGNFFRDAFGGYEERNHLVSPFETREGVPTRDQERRHPGFKKGIRPLRTNPYAFVGYSQRNSFGELLYQVDARGYLEDFKNPRAELITAIPVPRQWSLGLGAQIRSKDERDRDELSPDNNRRLSAFIGLGGPLLKGSAYIGLTGPSARLVVSYSRSW